MLTLPKTLKGANTTAQWYEDDFPGAAIFAQLDKFVLHTTETLSWPGYSGGASAPNATYHARTREIRQHFSNNRSSRALRDPDDTVVRENRDNVFQLEMICYSEKAKGDPVGGLWVGDLTEENYSDIARICGQLHMELGLPIESTVEWREGATGFYAGVRLSGPEFDAYKGILGHVHVSGNTHWDPGGFRYSRLEAALEGSTMDWNDKVVNNLDTGLALEVDQALSFIYTRQLRGEKEIDLLQSDVAAIKQVVTTLPPVEVVIDYDLLATKVVEKLMTDAELSFRKATP